MSLEPPVEQALPEPSAGALRADRVRRWIGILSAYFTAQSLTQLLSIAAGLVFIRFMPVHEFSLYTLAFSVISFFTFTTDLGSTTSLLHFYQRTNSEGTPFEPYFAAVLSLRRMAFLLGAAGVLLAFPLFASSKGFAWTPIALATAGILVHVWFQIQTSIRVLALRLRGRYAQSYRAEVSGAALRLLLAGAMKLTQLFSAWIGVAVTALGSALSATLARPQKPTVTWSEDLGLYRKRILRYLLPTLPSALYFSIQGPLTIWLSATFGSTRTIAEVGAVGRLGLIVGMFSSMIGVVFLPRLAAISDDRLYQRRALQYGSMLFLLAASLLAAAALLPRLFLLLLGPHYSGLHRELLLIVAGSGLALLGGYVGGVNFARGWIRFQGATLLVELATQVLLIRLLPLSSTAGVLVFTLLSTATGLSLQCVILALGFQRPAWVRWTYS